MEELNVSIMMRFYYSTTVSLCWRWIGAETIDREMGDIRNGTAFFLKTNHKTFGVTAAHNILDDVHGVRQSRRNSEISSCRLGEIEFDLEQRLIDIDPVIDIATFEVTDEEIQQVGCNVIEHSQPVWPPALPQINDKILMGGFPGIYRTTTTWGDNPTNYSSNINFSSIVVMGNVENINEREITVLWNYERALSVEGAEMPQNEERGHMGGISGGPLMIVEDGTCKTLRFGGVIIEGQPIYGFDMFKVKRADYINSDGTLNRRYGF